MKSALCVLGFAALVVAGASSCWVDTRSGEFACSTDSDCAGFSDPPRICDPAIHFCVPLECPGACDVCDFTDPLAPRCAISCGSGASSCGSVTCPAGFLCNVTCSGMSACGTINCGGAIACNVTCTGGNTNNEACNNVECGEGPCSVQCLTDHACDDADCNDSCQCDVTCASADACGLVDCQIGCESGLGCSSSLAGCTSTCP